MVGRHIYCRRITGGGGIIFDAHQLMNRVRNSSSAGAYLPLAWTRHYGHAATHSHAGGGARSSDTSSSRHHGRGTSSIAREMQTVHGMPVAGTQNSYRGFGHMKGKHSHHSAAGGFHNPFHGGGILGDLFGAIGLGAKRRKKPRGSRSSSAAAYLRRLNL